MPHEFAAGYIEQQQVANVSLLKVLKVQGVTSEAACKAPAMPCPLDSRRGRNRPRGSWTLASGKPPSTASPASPTPLPVCRDKNSDHDTSNSLTISVSVAVSRDLTAALVPIHVMERSAAIAPVLTGLKDPQTHLPLKQGPFGRSNSGSGGDRLVAAGQLVRVAISGVAAAEDLELRAQGGRLALQLRDARGLCLPPCLCLRVVHKVQHPCLGWIELTMSQPLLLRITPHTFTP